MRCDIPSQVVAGIVEICGKVICDECAAGLANIPGGYSGMACMTCFNEDWI